MHFFLTFTGRLGWNPTKKKRAHPTPISPLYLLRPLSIALEQIPPAKHLILCNQQQSSAGTHLITAPEIEQLCWERGSGMFCSFSCLVWDKAAPLRDLHSSARAGAMHQTWQVYLYGGVGVWAMAGGWLEAEGTQLRAPSIARRQTEERHFLIDLMTATDARPGSGARKAGRRWGAEEVVRGRC